MKLFLLVALFVLETVSAARPRKEKQICFDGLSYIRYEISPSNPLSSPKDEIKFKFRSTDASGLLLYAHSRGLNGDHVLLELVRGKLRVRYQLGRNSMLKQVIVGDGLGDDIVSTVTVTRDKKKITVSAYGGQSDKLDIVIPGEDDRLDLNGFIYVGGYLNPPLQYPSFHRVNFKGCMYQATFKSSYKVDFIDGAINKRDGFTSDIEETDNPKIPPRAMNFKRETFIRFVIQERDPIDPTKILKKLYGSLDFRTVLYQGTIFTASSVSLKFQQSQLSLISGADIISIDFPEEGQANDGRWFRIKFVVENNNLELQLNDVPRRIEPSNNPQYGAEITYGFYQNNMNFIGCIRNMVLQGVNITYYDIVDPYRVSKLADGFDKLSEGCKASDPCIPNPCFHGARCLAVAKDPGVECECLQKYHPPFCQFSSLATSCSAIKKYQPGRIGGDPRRKYDVDPDDSGPLPPVSVTCDYSKKTQGQEMQGLTEIETKETSNGVTISPPIDYTERFSYKKEIKYEVSIESVKAIVDRSEQCTQLVKYDCRDAKLFNAPGGDPASRWLSANGYLQYYWGGAKRDSYKCACAYTVKGCQGGGFCHCDSKLAETRAASDEGLLNVTRDLPVREVQFGGLSKTSQAIYTIKRIDCYGVDTLGVVTFLAPDGWVRAPPWNAPYGGDISFYLKTVFPTGDLIDHRNSDESHIFQVRIYDETTIEVVVSFGTSIRTKYKAAIDDSQETGERKKKLIDNEWHRIQVIRTLWELSVKIDDKPALDPVNKQPLRPLQLTGDGRSRLNIDLPMFVGSFWRFPTYKKGYVGCMKGFTINGVLFDLANAVDHLAMEPEVLVLKGCGNACEHKPCPYGTCVEQYTSYKCDCSETPFYGTYCSKEIGTKIQNSPVYEYANLTMASSKYEKIVLAFSTEAVYDRCHGTLFQILSEDEAQYYKLSVIDRNSLEFEFRLLPLQREEKLRIDVGNIDFCDRTRHIVNIERTVEGSSESKIKYRIDGRKIVERDYQLKAVAEFKKPYKYYVGNTKVQGTDDVFVGCISGAKFHLYAADGAMPETVEPIARGIRSSNGSLSPIEHQSCGPTINTPIPMTTREIPGPTTPTDYPSTEFLRDVGIHEAEDTNWAVLIVVALLLMLVLVAVVVLTIWFVMQHKNDYQILEKADGTVIGTATVRGGNASVASVPAAGSTYFAPARAAPSVASTGNLSRAKSKSNDLFV